MRRMVILLIAATATLFPVSVVGAAPEIAHIHPDYAGQHLSIRAPHLITGEGFWGKGVEIWTYTPPADETRILAAADRLAAKEALLPKVPPQGSRRVEMLDSDGRVLMAYLGGSALVWVKSASGISSPYLINAAKPFWISRDEAEQGSVLHIFGFGLQPHEMKIRLALVGSGGRPVLLEPGWNPRGMRDVDSRLVYFRLPSEMQPGAYQVFLHNGYGGEYGWRPAGDLKVLARTRKEPRIFDVREFGAKGDGKSNDFSALTAAMKAAAEAASTPSAPSTGSGQAVVFLPAGTYMTDECLRVPEGVILRGISREASRITGFGYDPTRGFKMFYTTDLLPSPVMLLASRTGLESLSVSGYVSKGPAGTSAMVEAYGNEVRDLLIRDCSFFGTATHPVYGTQLYRFGQAMRLWGLVRNARIVGNEFNGGLGFATAVRAEVADNTFRGGSVSGYVYDSLLDGNFFVDAPTRVLFYTVRHSYLRYNEMRGYFRDSWQNAPEAYLIHGGDKKTVGTPTAATVATLTDSRQNWGPGRLRDFVVLITAGKGFGQYRFVADNTKDTLMVTEPWRVQPDAASEYVVGRFFVDSAYYANSIDSTGVLSLWLDCIGINVERYRALAGGINVWGRDSSRLGNEGISQGEGLFCPSWYNTLIDNWMDGTGLSLDCFEDKANAYRGPTLFGTYVLNNRITQPQMERIGHSAFRPYGRGGIRLNGAARWNVIADNFVGFSNIGVLVSDEACKNFILNNEFQEVEAPVLDRGFLTMQKGNRVLRIEQEADRREALPDTPGRAGSSVARPR